MKMCCHRRINRNKRNLCWQLICGDLLIGFSKLLLIDIHCDSGTLWSRSPSPIFRIDRHVIIRKMRFLVSFLGYIIFVLCQTYFV